MDEEDISCSSKRRRYRPKINWLKAILCGCIGAAVLFFLLLWQMSLTRGKRPADRTEATNNAKQLWFALTEFDTDYGSFPNESTVEATNSQYPKPSYDFSGSSSNALFRQIIAGGITESEKIFYARIEGVKKPDNIITNGNLLAKGEVGFSYVSGLSSKDDPKTPIVLTPMIPGTTKFDIKAFNGEAVILYVDGDVKNHKIDKDGHVYENGVDILSSSHPVWKGKTPDIRYPDL